MSESPEPKFLVRDPQGNVFGPADADMLRRWVTEGRIVPGMSIAPHDSPSPTEWTEASIHPATADLLQQRLKAIMETQSSPSSSPQSLNTPATVTRTDPVLGYGPPLQRQNLLGIFSFTAGIFALLGTLPSCFCPCFAPVPSLLALAAIVLGALGSWQVKVNPQLFRGRALAIQGLSMGVLTLLIYLTFIIVSAIHTFTAPP